MLDEQSLKKNFLGEISDQIFPVSTSSETQKLCFQLRFSPENWQQKNVDIASQMTEKLGAFNEASIGTTIREVLDKLKQQFGEEMAKHGINLDKRKRGRPANDKESPWRIAYGWLWEHKFPYWQMDWLWQDLIQKAASPYRWLRFTQDYNRIFVPESKKYEIVIDVPYYMHVELDCDQEHLLLLHRGIYNNGVITNYILCPSQAFAPDNRLKDKTMLMPQSGAMCEEITFDTVGQEEFLAIVLDDSLDFPWLTPNEEEPAPIWNLERLKELWTRLGEDNNNWQAFYRSFEVVEASA
ncbi:hypothetical protein [Moorena bouillonii]|uniref:DUF4384 domain-containing protein n=1 Tax=Moorena bouillonii PNG TaxID=568701 RepID=A0A1U7NAA2_9CYAN|nr:hypothetical protein [Moorena bouillonii]OLT62876.1 hypothetical protein BJP37_31410 [Moorena bouillonii PNG]